MRTRRSGSRDPVKVREHVMVEQWVFDHFHREWRRIEREWRNGGLKIEDVALRPDPASYSKMLDPGMFEAVAAGVNAARAELRAWVRAMAKESPGAYLVPV